MNDVTTNEPLFAESYAEARGAFLRACAQAGAEREAHRHPLAGPDGTPLFLDVATFGPRVARRVLFLSSGTHGIEGFCGSAIQTFLVRDGLAERLPPDTGLVLVHAVNPWGFAWLRRVNEDNVDLNRNFLDHEAGHPENPDYDRLYDALNPASLDVAVVAAAIERLQMFQEEAGFESYYRATTGGQYRHARGVQYGGREPAWSNRILRGVWGFYAKAAEVALAIDLHSGLGPRGMGVLLQTARAESAAARLAAACWSDVARFDPAEGTNAALASGLIGPAFVDALPHAASAGIVLEFGTHSMEQVGLAVVADNWLQHHGRRDSPEGQAIQRQMREAFLIENAEWKEKVCMRAKDVVEGALTGMAEFSRDEVRP